MDIINDDGGAAFPTEHWKACENSKRYQRSGGMSLRDWFAGQAMAGLAGDPSWDGPVEKNARWCYQFADAMIEARESP